MAMYKRTETSLEELKKMVTGARVSRAATAISLRRRSC